MKRSTVLLLMLFLFLSALTHAQVPQKISYQGMLTTMLGTPATDGSYNLKFDIYNLPSAGTLRYTQTINGVGIVKGAFGVILGPLTNIFSESLYVQVSVLAGPGVGTTQVFLPRTELTSFPYAFHAIKSDTAEYAKALSTTGVYLPLGGGSMTGAITNTGDPEITMGKGNFGSGNVNSGGHAFVAGFSNTASGIASAIGGGQYNITSGNYATVGGGWSDTASAIGATVGGGYKCRATASNATVAGGYNNLASGGMAIVGGGSENRAIGNFSAILGGTMNTTDGIYSAVVNGQGNIASGLGSIVCAGNGNVASGLGSFVGGGGDGEWMGSNIASGEYSFIGGGRLNRSLGSNSVVPGGRENVAGGNYSFAAGRRAKASYSGNFVWADSTDEDFASTANNQFLIRAGGGVGINTNTPGATLEVNGNMKIVDGTQGSGNVLTSDENGLASWQPAPSGSGDYLPISGGTMGGAITSINDPEITMGKGNFGTGNINSGVQAFVAGAYNRAEGDFSVVCGGGGGLPTGNSATGFRATISGGQLNKATNRGTTVSGGSSNRANGLYSVVSGGGGDYLSDSNSTSGDYSTICGGTQNRASGANSGVGGGFYNRATGNSSTVAGGRSNQASLDYTTVSGGSYNLASGLYSTVGGGQSNSTSNDYVTICGGGDNVATGYSSTVGGGALNQSNGYGTTVSGGTQNKGLSGYAVIAGGTLNEAVSYATIGGGVGNYATGESATIGGGSRNRARGKASVVSGGGGIPADSNSAIGDYSTIPGGQQNLAGGAYSFAAGFRAKANHNGAFVWGDNTNADFSSTGTNQFLIRANGNVGVNTNSPTSPLTVNGIVQSTTGGFKFPDGTTQTTAASSGGVAGGDLTGTYPNPTIANNAVTTGKILDGTIQRGDVQTTFKAPYADTSDYAKSAPPGGTAGGDLTGTFPNPTIVNNAVTTGKILDGTIQRVDVQTTFKAPYADTSDYAKTAPPIGSAGGNLTGTYPNPTIANGAITFSKIGQNSATTGQVMKWNGSAWLAANDSVGATGSFLPLSGGTMTGAITSTGDPAIKMGKGNFGSGSTNSGTFAFVAGFNNTSSGIYTAVVGGEGNLASGLDATVGGGLGNQAIGVYSAVVNGQGNIASGLGSIVCAGNGNVASGLGSFVGGGGDGEWMGSNIASGEYSFIGGGRLNRSLGSNSVVPGGRENVAGGNYSFAAGRRAKASYSGNFVWADSTDEDFASTANNQFLIRAGGGVGINTNTPGATLGVNGSIKITDGTQGSGKILTSDVNGLASWQPASSAGSGVYLPLSGGTLTGPLKVNGIVESTTGGFKFPDATTQTTSALPLTGGMMSGAITSTGNPEITMGKGNFGSSNLNSGVQTFVAGSNNMARGDYSAIGGGGGATVADSNSTVGAWATVPGGRRNSAFGGYSFAAGRNAKANHIGAFVWADNGTSDFTSSADGQFSVRAAGGTRIYSNSGLTAGVTLAPGANAWVAVSDSTKKRNIRVVDTQKMLEKVAKLPIKQWSYLSQDASIEHVGPMAQDFYSIFRIGESDTTISTIDPPGIALAAIQELYKQNQSLTTRIAELEAIVKSLASEKKESSNKSMGELR